MGRFGFCSRVTRRLAAASSTLTWPAWMPPPAIPWTVVAPGRSTSRRFPPIWRRSDSRGSTSIPPLPKARWSAPFRAAGRFVDSLPLERLAPETTEGREGFLHPYDLQGGVGKATLRVLLRDFDTQQLAEQAAVLKDTAEQVEAAFPGLSIRVDVTPQYRNMAEGLEREPRAVALAEQAHQRRGHPAQRTIIRGGTDGSQLTERGLATPNLSSGQHNPHSPLEWVCLDEMVDAVEMLVQLVQLWGEQSIEPPTGGGV